MPKSKGKNSSRSGVTCLACNVTFRSLPQYVSHLSRDASCQKMSNKCEKCNSIFATERSLNYHQATNSFCINLEDQVSRIGPEFNMIGNSSSKKQCRLIDKQKAKINIDFQQSTSLNTNAQTYHSGSQVHESLQYPNVDPINNNRQVLLSPKTITNHLNQLKRQFPLGLLNSPSYNRSVFIVKILKEKNEWKERQLNGSVDAIVNEIKQHIFNLRVTSGKPSLPKYQFPFTFESISKEELTWFVNYHNNTYIDSEEHHGPQVYQEIDNPEDVEADENEDSHFSFELVEPETQTVLEEQNVSDGEHEINIDTSVDQFVQDAKHYQSLGIFDSEDVMLLELFQILRDAGAPMYVFDKLTSWGRKNARLLLITSPTSREKFFSNIGTKTYGTSLAKAMEPITEKHIMPSTGAEISLNRYSFKAQLASILLNEDIMNEKNLLLNPEDPFSPLLADSNTTLDDVNSGWWHKETSDEVCKNTGEILMPIWFFVDAGKVTNRQSVEPITFTLGILNRSVYFILYRVN